MGSTCKPDNSSFVDLNDLPIMSFLFPCTKSFPATLTRENFNCFPILITWLQFSTFLNGILIGGFDACFH